MLSIPYSSEFDIRKSGCVCLQEDMSKEQINSEHSPNFTDAQMADFSNSDASEVFLFSILLSVLKKCFDDFDREKKGYITGSMVGHILSMMGLQFNSRELGALVKEIDVDGKMGFSVEWGTVDRN